MLRPRKAGNYPKIGHWPVFVLFGWRFVFGITMRWEGREPFPFRYHDCGISKAAFLLLLSFATVSNTKDMLNRWTCQEILVEDRGLDYHLKEHCSVALIGSLLYS